MPTRRAARAALLTALLLAPITTGAPGSALARPGAADDRPGTDVTMPAVDPGLWTVDGTVHALARIGDTLYVGGEFSSFSVQTGAGFTVDAHTGLLSRSTPAVGGTNSAVYASVSDGAGGWFVGGEFVSVGNLPRTNLAHIRADGTLSAWAPIVNGAVKALQVQGGTLYVGGGFTAVDGQARAGLAAFDAAVGALLAWNPGVNGIVSSLAASASTVYVAGAFSSVGGLPRASLAAVDAASGAVLDWNPGAEYYVTCLALHGGTLYAGGDFYAVGGRPRRFLAAMDAATGGVTDWDPEAVAPPWDPSFGADIIYSIAASDSTVYVGGYFQAVGGKPRRCVAALSARTGLATDWYPSIDAGYVNWAWPLVLSIDVRGSTVLIGGAFLNGWPGRRANVAAVDATTGADLGWNLGTDLAVTSVALGEDGAYVGGIFRRVQLWRFGLGAFDLRTGAPTSWGPGLDGTVRALVADPGRRAVFIGGRFEPGLFITTANLAAVDPVRGLPVVDPFLGVAVPFPGTNGEVDALAFDGVTLYAGGAFTTIGESLLPRRHLAAVIGATGEVTPWAPDPDGPVDALAFDGTRVFAGGRFAAVGGAPHAHLAAVGAATGAPDPGFAEANGAVRALWLDRGTLYAGGEFTAVGGATRPYLASVDARSGGVNAWSPAPDGSVSALAMHGHTLLAGGGFRNVGGRALASLAAFEAGAEPALPWYPNADGDVRALLATGGWVIAGGAFTNVSGERHPGIARIAFDDPGGADVGPGTAPAACSLLPCTPNPARASVVLRFELPAPARVSLAVFDVHGRRVASPLDRVAQAAGRHALSLPTSGWPAGLYLCRLDAGGTNHARKLIVVR
jgi:hypothetical protein